MPTRSISLSPLDRQMLGLLDTDARLTVSELARRLKTGRERAEYRLNRLLDSNVITRFFPYINLGKLGYTLFRTYFRLDNKHDRVASFVRATAAHRRVYWIAMCDGEWDLVVLVYALNSREFLSIHGEIVARYKDLILDFSTYTLAEAHLYSRKYLAPISSTSMITGMQEEVVTIDDHDFSILRELTGPKRLTVVDVAERVGLMPHIVRYRIRQLEERGVLTGYRIDLNLAALGLLRFKTQLFLRNLDAGFRKRLREFCARHPNILFYIEQVGDCNIEIEMEVEDYTQYAKVVGEIRRLCGPALRNCKTLLLRDVVLHSLPMDLDVRAHDTKK